MKFRLRHWIKFVVILVMLQNACDIGIYSSFAGDYSERPDILSQNVKTEESKRDQLWDQLKESHVEAISEILGMYPDRQNYFLARDGELLYDTARLLTHELKDKDNANRIHLINVSRPNMHDSHLKNYLE